MNANKNARPGEKPEAGAAHNKNQRRQYHAAGDQAQHFCIACGGRTTSRICPECRAWNAALGALLVAAEQLRRVRHG